MRSTLVSIVVPTRNGAATLPALFDAVGRQRVDFDVEIVAIDSGSTDGTPELLRARADRVLEIAAAAFDHGTTRNLGIAQAHGELIVLTVQDAEPANDDWLRALTSPLRADDALAGTFARQVPRGNASAITRRHMAGWAGAALAARTLAIGGADAFEALSPAERLDRCTFDNVCSCIRRSVWQRHPFRATPIAEDLEWARDVLLAGHRLAYVPESVVIHSHERPVREEFARTRVLHSRLRQLFGLRTIPTSYALARAIASTLAAHLACETSARAAALAVAWPLGQYLGGRGPVRPSTPPPNG
jgi:rhamnosyltransferase